MPDFGDEPQPTPVEVVVARARTADNAYLGTLEPSFKRRCLRDAHAVDPVAEEPAEPIELDTEEAEDRGFQHFDFVS